MQIHVQACYWSLLDYTCKSVPGRLPFIDNVHLDPKRNVLQKPWTWSFQQCQENCDFNCSANTLLCSSVGIRNTLYMQVCTQKHICLLKKLNMLTSDSEVHCCVWLLELLTILYKCNFGFYALCKSNIKIEQTRFLTDWLLLNNFLLNHLQVNLFLQHL